jgi:hypothetical protein
MMMMMMMIIIIIIIIIDECVYSCKHKFPIRVGFHLSSDYTQAQKAHPGDKFNCIVARYVGKGTLI